MTATAEPSPVGAPFDDLDPPARPLYPAPGELDLDALPSADDHYAAACQQLDRADGNAYNIAMRESWIRSANTHLRAAEYALSRWPNHDPDRQLLEENFTMAAELARLLPVAQAARDFIAAAKAQQNTPAAHVALAAAVEKLDADA